MIKTKRKVTINPELKPIAVFSIIDCVGLLIAWLMGKRRENGQP